MCPNKNRISKDVMRYSKECLIGQDCCREENFDQGLYECVLPTYLKKDLLNYLKGKEESSSLVDCLWGELYSSINIAEINDGLITHDQAQYLRDKYLWGVEA